MALIHLEVSGLRNLTSVSLAPSIGFNLLYGANGSGKTSLLEAIHLLGLARSFRTQQGRKLIQAGGVAATVFGRVDRGDAVYGLGVQKQIGDITVVKVNGARQESASVLAELLPLQVLTPESHSLLQGEPKERRSYMDWGLFHVEQSFFIQWKRYRRYLDQRNAALRSGAYVREMQQWEYGLAESGEAVSQLRETYLGQITPHFAHIYSVLLEAEAPRIVYRRGWSQDTALAQILERNRASEQGAGYTMAGPHRADYRLVLPNGQDAADVFSRGQQKLAVCALRIAQMQHVQERAGQRCTLLVDDLPAELDGQRRGLLLSAIAASGAQCFITATDHELVDLSPWQGVTMFHVEHGVVKEVV